MAHFSSTTGWLPSDSGPRRYEPELVRAARLGDKRAFQELVYAYDHLVLSFALNVMQSEEDAQRIYQQVFLKAFATLPDQRFETSFFIWIYRLAANFCQQDLQRESKRKRPVVPIRSVPPNSRHALAQLSARERIVLVLFHQGRLRASTIAQILETSEDVVKDALSRAVYKVRSVTELSA